MLFSHFFILSLALLSPLSVAGTWNGYNNPANMDVSNNYVYNINKLPTKASLAVLPWSETYWPTYKGSINIRWNTVDKDGFYYDPPTREEVKRMSLNQLKQLAPSEKYDIFMNRYDYPLFHEAQWYSNPKAEDWSGICDGWAIAALQYAEPQAVTMPNPEGIMVPFGSSDIKALMSFEAAIHFEVDTRQVGTKCGRWGTNSACSDINAGALHVLLANQIGLKKQGFVTERDPGREIWNQPTYGFEFKYLGSANSDDGDQGVYVHATLYYTDELEDSSWDPVVGTPKFKFDKIEMDYILDLDYYDNIIGGTWIGGTDHPDFAWLPVNKLTFTGYLAGVNKLYQPVKPSIEFSGF